MLPKLTDFEVRVHAVSLSGVLTDHTTKLTPTDRYRVFDRTVDLLRGRLVEMTAVFALRSGGWTVEAILEAPLGTLADWLREYGGPAVVSALDDDGEWVVTGIRDEVRCQHDKLLKLLPYKYK